MKVHLIGSLLCAGLLIVATSGGGSSDRLRVTP
jgi:hypothetical protein